MYYVLVENANHYYLLKDHQIINYNDDWRNGGFPLELSLSIKTVESEQPWDAFSLIHLIADKKSCKAKLKELVTEEAQDDHVQTTNSTAKRSLPEEESYQQQFSQALKLMKEKFDRKLKQTTIDLRAEFNAKLAEMRKAQQQEILAISKAADVENIGTNSQFVCSSSGIALNPSDVIQAIA